MISLRERLADSYPLLADGAISTLLMQRGYPVHPIPEVNNYLNPAAIENICTDYIDCGADLITTNTFNSSYTRLSDLDLADKSEDINFTAAAIASEAAYERGYVMASIGPMQQNIKENRQVLSSWEIKQGIQLQLEPMLKTRVDAAIIETVINITEACQIVNSVREIAPNMIIIVSVFFKLTHNGYQSLDGYSIKESIEMLEDVKPDIIGSNCSNIKDLLNIARTMRQASSIPLIMQPNAGLPVRIDSNPTWVAQPQNFARQCMAFIDAGVKIIGGCCGTNAEFTRLMREEMDKYSSRE